MRKNRKPQLRVEHEADWHVLRDAQLTEFEEEVDHLPALEDGIPVYQLRTFTQRDYQKITTECFPTVEEKRDSLLQLPFDVLNNLPLDARVSDDRVTLLSLAKSCRWFYHIFIPKIYETVNFQQDVSTPCSRYLWEPPYTDDLETFRLFLRTIEDNSRLREVSRVSPWSISAMKNLLVGKKDV